MPRTGRGGKRSGNPGTAYPNRTDLAADRQPIAAPQGQEYGERGRQEAAQQQVPLPDIAAMAASLPGLTDPTQRPAEPLTAGAPIGPGPGPEALAAGPPPNTGKALIQAMVRENPSPELFALLADLG